MANDTATAGKSTKTRNLEFSYRNRDGTVVDKFTSDISALIFTVLGNGDKIVGELAPLFGGELPPVETHAMAIMAAAFGLKTAASNAVTGLRDDEKGDPDAQAKAVRDRVVCIVEEGEWREGREGGPMTRHVIEAYVAFFEKRRGQPANEKQRAAIEAEVKSLGAKKVLDNAHIKLEYDAAELKRAEEKVAKSKAKAAEVDPAGLDALMALE